MTDYVVFTLVFAAIMIAALRSGRGVGTETDFALAGRSATSGDVAWIIIGTLVGGAATVGTVQMAYLYGFAAWHFTLGSGLACLVLAFVFSRALRESESITVAQFLGRHFGPRFRTYSSLIASGGMLMQIVAQFLATVALIGRCSTCRHWRPIPSGPCPSSSTRPFLHPWRPCCRPGCWSS